jgi:hypothetical protein
MDDLDPTYTDPDKYKTIFEDDRVRVLDYRYSRRLVELKD